MFQEGRAPEEVMEHPLNHDAKVQKVSSVTKCSVFETESETDSLLNLKSCAFQTN